MWWWWWRRQRRQLRVGDGAAQQLGEHERILAAQLQQVLVRAEHVLVVDEVEVLLHVEVGEVVAAARRQVLLLVLVVVVVVLVGERWTCGLGRLVFGAR